MSNIVFFPRASYQINNTVVPKPRNSDEYLQLAKRFLLPDAYKDICAGIMDSEHYDTLSPELKNVVDNYLNDQWGVA